MIEYTKESMDQLLEALYPTVRHHMLICPPCAMLFPTPQSMVGTPVGTLCGRLVVYAMPDTWCEDCKDVVLTREYEGVCGICDKDIYFHG